MNILEANNINSGYGKKQILHNICIEILPNNLVLLIGSNGSGKSTLLKTLFGILPIWGRAGKILFNNEDITSNKPQNNIKKGLVYIPQKNELFDSLSVRDNLNISCMASLRNYQQSVRLDKVIEQIPSLKPLLNRDCGVLSGGERKMVTFGMALMNRPKLVLFDEPLSGVSPNNASQIIKILCEMRGNKISILVVEHRIKDLFDLADSVIALKLGELYNHKIVSLEDTKGVML